MSSTTVIRERDIILTQSTRLDKMRVKYIIQDYNNRVNLRPDYQRDLRWSIEMYNAFINTIMNKCYMLNIVLYKLHLVDTPEPSAYKYECIDGQHRLNAIMHFYKSLPIDVNNKKNMITWYHKKTDTYVFYSENDDTRTWESENSGKKVAYMSSNEIDDFDECEIPIDHILCPLSYDQRCKEFVSLQQGKQVRNSDLFKNYIDIPLISFIHKDMRLEPIYKRSISSRLTSKTSQNWIFSAVRMFMIIIDGKSKVGVWVKNTDTGIKKQLEKRMPKIYDISPEQLLHARGIIQRFVSFLDSLHRDIKFTPVQLLAIFVHLHVTDFANDSILKTRLTTTWAGDSTKEYTNMWYQKKYIESINGVSRQTQYYKECLEYLSSDSPIIDAPIVTQRKPFGKKKRDQLWKRNFGIKLEGICFCCEKDLNKSSDWHAGHIIAHAKTGTDDYSNLKVICKKCNLGCGTENLLEYKKRNFDKPTSTTPEVQNENEIDVVEVSFDGNLYDLKPLMY
jgi:5-methylcytosine-specific restriction endonuclease McrA